MEWCQNVRLECHNLLIKGNIQCGMVPRGSVYTGGKRKHTTLKLFWFRDEQDKAQIRKLMGKWVQVPGARVGRWEKARGSRDVTEA